MATVRYQERVMLPALVSLVLLAAAVTAARAQSSSSAPAPSTPSAPPVSTPSPAQQRLDSWRRSRVDVWMNDFGELGHFRDADAALKPPAAGEDRVVFFGDSITDFWKLADYFPGKPYINRGISGQTTPQMLLRFRQDVIDLQPRVVVILAGTNDIAGNTGPMALEQIEANYASIAELATVHGIHIVYASVTPVNNYVPAAADFFTTRPPEKILALNRWLKDYCAAQGLTYLDYYTAMVDDKGFLKQDLSDDGLHPNAAGYRVMAPLAESAIQTALRTAPRMERRRGRRQ